MGTSSADESYVTASQTEAQCLIAAKPIREPDERRWWCRSHSPLRGSSGVSPDSLLPPQNPTKDSLAPAGTILGRAQPPPCSGVTSARLCTYRMNGRAVTA